ncbi:uncharacterized protein LOC116342104 [Contarinia nasturtii]|uniref:uncharacterized protein LOC116342104 n=1 Tax=Contarinia nasturtii TaxID=265458 RepID=UPI0012D38CC9|nr:uncharacterized protein LOC116342104 [Contarinia nasturtii]
MTLFTVLFVSAMVLVSVLGGKIFDPEALNVYYDNEQEKPAFYEGIHKPSVNFALGELSMAVNHVPFVTFMTECGAEPGPKLLRKLANNKKPTRQKKHSNNNQISSISADINVVAGRIETAFNIQRITNDEFCSNALSINKAKFDLHSLSEHTTDAKVKEDIRNCCLDLHTIQVCNTALIYKYRSY